MTFVLFLLYAAIGGGVGYGVFTLTDVGLPMSIAAGGITTALLGQIHLLASSGPVSYTHLTLPTIYSV